MDKRYRILAVDDEYINTQLIKSSLREDYDILTAVSGYEAIDLLKQYMPDLILLDVMMPDMSGFEVCKIIKADPALADIPVIFLTALDSQEGQLQGLELGGIDYVSKPFNLELLKLRVRNHLALKERNDLVKEQRDLLARQKGELEAALAQVKQLEGIIPICAYCKKIRDDKNSWHQLEAYISDHSEALFSHGICPDCLGKQMELVDKMRNTGGGF
jgi:response regulator RpfG family c-di-GMP phosphodiesterase